MRISKMIKPLCFLVLICMLNMLLSYMLEYANGASKTMWEQYYAEDKIDAIFIGASVCSASFDPEVFDERLGLNTFNMGTPAQNTEQTVRALEVALEEHDIKTVIYGMGYFSLQQSSNEDAELTFVKALSRQQGGMKGLETTFKYLFSGRVRDKEKSIKYFFPWLYNGIDCSIKNIVDNLNNRFSGNTNVFDASSDERKDWILNKGFRPYTGRADYESRWDENSFRNYYQYFDYESTYYFEQVLKLCKEKDVDLLVINTPHPAYDVVSCYDTYEMNDKQVKELCEKHKIDYFDFSLAKPEIFQIEEDFYYDYEHLNYQGAQEFSKAVCDFMIKRNEGEDMEKYFYSTEDYFNIHNSLIEEWKKE